jgi:nickel-dependent lactate racemase
MPVMGHGRENNYKESLLMSSFLFHYGHSGTVFNIPEKYDICQVLPRSIIPDLPEGELIQNALSQPLNHCEISRLFSPDSKVVIVINDKTRPVPNGSLIPPLLEKLRSLSIKKENICFIIGMGTHIPMPMGEFEKILPPNIIKEYSVIAHNCDDDSNLVYKGATSAGTLVYVNRLFDTADVRIVVGNIEPHHFAAFSGGVKSAAIGVCGRKTINANHSLLQQKGSTLGNFETNPLRQDIEEIGRIIGVTLALNVVMNTEKQILACFWGQPQDVMKAGIAISRSVSMQPVQKLVDLVIASAGGYPKDINLYQAQKAMTHASHLLKPGGIILLAAACEEGIGSQGYADFMQGVNSVGQVFEKFNQQGFAVGPHKAILMARIVNEHPVLLMSTLPPSKVRQLLLTPVSSIDEGLEQALSLNPAIHSIAILPFAVSTIPFVQSQVEP